MPYIFGDLRSSGKSDAFNGLKGIANSVIRPADGMEVFEHAAFFLAGLPAGTKDESAQKEPRKNAARESKGAGVVKPIVVHQPLNPCCPACRQSARYQGIEPD